MSAGFEAPLLARPGAGLPAPELLLSQVLLALVRATSSRASALRRFLSEARRISGLVAPLDDRVGGQQVLVPRLLGLEDSSRFWSPFMVVEHLCIVDSNMFRIMTDLVAGRLHPDPARIENFKPGPTAGRASLVVFEHLVAEFVATVPQWPNLHTEHRHAHPWFGPLDAHGWLCLAGIHHAIHRRQLERILSGALANQLQ
jgi:hypothetical protein